LLPLWPQKSYAYYSCNACEGIVRSQSTSAPIQQEPRVEQQLARQGSQAEHQAHRTVEVYGNKEAREKGDVFLSENRCSDSNTWEKLPQNRVLIWFYLVIPFEALLAFGATLCGKDG
jgi:hypothetical protein